MLAALRYRVAQATVLGVLSALIVTGAVFAPLYQRAILQATVHTRLDTEPITGSGVAFTSTVDSAGVGRVVDPQALSVLLEGDARALFLKPVLSRQVGVSTLRRKPPMGALMWREDQCQHVRFVAGTCPSRAAQVAITADQAKVLKWTVGSPQRLRENDASTDAPGSRYHELTVTVVGIYQTDETDPYWYGTHVTGWAQHDALDLMLTDQATIDSAVPGEDTWIQTVSEADFAIAKDRVGLDELLRDGPAAAKVIQNPAGQVTAGSSDDSTPDAPVYAVSNLQVVVADVVAAGQQARIIVPLLVAQLALFLGCVLWLVLVSAADQRRGEVAVARLRGLGPRGAYRLLLSETLPAVLVGVPVGIVLGFGLSWFARHVLLPGDAPFELRSAAPIAAVLVTVAMAGLTLLSVRRVATEPAVSLLRAVPPRRAGLGLGVLEAMLVAAALAAYGGVLGGGVTGPVATAAPTLLAIGTGVLVARVAGPVSAGTGRYLLGRGRLSAGTALLQSARRPSTRWIIPVVVVAVALATFAANAVAVGARNRADRALVETGAPYAAQLLTRDLDAASAVVAEADPSGRALTSIVRVTGPNSSVPSTVAVDPATFPVVTSWPNQDPSSFGWRSITMSLSTPIEVKGTSAALHLTMPPTRPSAVASNLVNASAAPLRIGVQVVQGGDLVVIDLADVPSGGTARRAYSTIISCSAGCRVTGLAVSTNVGAAPLSGTFTIDGLTVDGKPVDLETSQDWDPADVGEATMQVTAAGPGRIAATFDNAGLSAVVARSRAVPAKLPALVSPGVDTSDQGEFDVLRPNGSSQTATTSGRIPFIPGLITTGVVVDREALLRLGATAGGEAQVIAYAKDRRALDALKAAAAKRNLAIGTVTEARTAQQVYDRTAPAWGLALALVLGALGILIAALALLVLTATSWRARTRDYAGLRMAGLPAAAVSRAVVLESLPVVLLGGLVGLVAGLLGGRAAMPGIPLFPTPPPVDTENLGLAWGPAIGAGVLGTLVLALVVVAGGRWVAARAHLARLREG